jgi:membrane protein
VIVLIWVYYTAQLVLMGAEFTNVYACRWGSKRGQAERERRQIKPADQQPARAAWWRANAPQAPVAIG